MLFFKLLLIDVTALISGSWTTLFCFLFFYFMGGVNIIFYLQRKPIKTQMCQSQTGLSSIPFLTLALVQFLWQGAALTSKGSSFSLGSANGSHGVRMESGREEKESSPLIHGSCCQ